MRGQRDGRLSAITQVKVFSPEIINSAPGQGFHFLEASIATCVKGECVSGVPGSQSMAGNRTVHVGTWENHIVPRRSLQQAEEARRRYDGMVVGLTHIRGVAGAMPGGARSSLEGVSSKTPRDEEMDKTIRTGPISYVIEADIKGFFDHVSHSRLMEFLQVRIKDPSFLLLIRRFLKAGYCEAGMIVATEQGTPQGGNLSPTLSNIFLHYVLDLWFEKKVKPRSRGACQLVRYADDFICMVQYADEAQHLEQALRERFAKFDLELHPEKTRVISFGRYERSNAQRQNRKTNTFDFLGFTHICATSRKGKFIVGRKTNRKKFRKACQEMNHWLRKTRNCTQVKQWWPILQAKLRGHYQYYGVSGNMRALRRFYTRTLRMILKWLNRRSQRKSFNWDGFKEYLKHYPLPQPKIVHNLYTLSPVT